MKLKTLLELERQQGKVRPLIIDELIYKNGDRYYQIVTDDADSEKKLTALGFDKIPRINCFDKEIKKINVNEFRAKILELGIDIFTSKEISE